MLIAPRRTKFRKSHLSSIRPINFSKGGCHLLHGRYGLRALKANLIKPEQIEASRRIITRQVKKKARLWIRYFPDRPVTKKPSEVRMGKGKGSVEYWIDRVSAGRILFELDGIPETLARKVLQDAANKLPIPTSIVVRF